MNEDTGNESAIDARAAKNDVSHETLRRATPSVHVGSLEQYRRLIESLTEYAIFYISPEGLIESWNAGAEQTFGYTAQEVLGRHFGLIFTPEDRKSGLPESELGAAEMTGRGAIDGWHVRKDGSRFWCTNTMQPLIDESGTLTGFTKIIRDATEQHLAAEALRESEERLRLLIESATEYAIFALDEDGIVTSWNSGAAQIFGYAEAEIVGKPVAMLYGEAAVAAGIPASELSAAKRNGRAEDSGWHVRKNGSRFFASGHTELLKADDRGRSRGFVKICHDTTTRNDLEEGMRRKALYDDLTTLPNRASFREYLSRSIDEAQESVGIRFAVLYLDLDGFKEVNDNLGHAAGDDLLVSFARLLERCSRPGDIVSRAGGDEFTVLLTGVSTTRDALSVAERINVALRKPFVLSGQHIRMTASIGVVVGSSLYRKADQIIRDADRAMYQAKARGGAQHALFPSLAADAVLATPN